MTEIFAPGPQVGNEPRGGQESCADAHASARASSTLANTTVVERCLGLTAVLALGFCASELSGGHVSQFVGGPPTIMILSVVLGGLVMSHGAAGLARFAAVCAGGRVRSNDEARQLRGICRRGRRLCYAGAWIMMLVAVMHVLSVLDLPSLIGSGVAISLQAPLMAVLVGEVLFGAAEYWCVGPELQPSASPGENP